MTLLEQYIQHVINENINSVNTLFIEIVDKFDCFRSCDEFYNKNIVDFVIFAKVFKLLLQDLYSTDLYASMLDEIKDDTLFMQKLRRSTLFNDNAINWGDYRSTKIRRIVLNMLNVEALGKYTPNALRNYDIVIYHDDYDNLQYISEDNLRRVLKIAKNYDEFIILLAHTMRDVT